MLPTISTFDVNRVGNFLFLQKHLATITKLLILITMVRLTDQSIRSITRESVRFDMKYTIYQYFINKISISHFTQHITEC